LTENVSYAAFLKYTPKTHEVPVVLFRCQKPNSSVFLKIADEPDHGWKRWARGPLVVHEIDCEHMDLLKPPMLPQVMAQTAAELRI
jgi:thioesterase domain-containing protein